LIAVASMNQVEKLTARMTGSKTAGIVEEIQSLWSGYGSIVRVSIDDDTTVICKHIKPPSSRGGRNHPRGWTGDLSHERKVRSYAVETQFYTQYAPKCPPQCRVPTLIGVDYGERAKDERFLLLEDLDAAGWPMRHRMDKGSVVACLRWLAAFHATFMCVEPDGLWPVGTYWHLETRPDELEAMAPNSRRLKNAADAIDARLSAAKYKTIVHGDMKLENVCFRSERLSKEPAVAVVDFQYCGGGCGMKDVAYFLGSCLDSKECARGEEEYLAVYFAELRKILDGSSTRTGRNVAVDFDELEIEWRALFPFAVADFHRFLCGWAPDHWKINPYSEAHAERVIAKCEEART
jgi:hypothetical protein